MLDKQSPAEAFVISFFASLPSGCLDLAMAECAHLPSTRSPNSTPLFSVCHFACPPLCGQCRRAEDCIYVSQDSLKPYSFEKTRLVAFVKKACPFSLVFVSTRLPH